MTCLSTRTCSSHGKQQQQQHLVLWCQCCVLSVVFLLCLHCKWLNFGSKCQLWSFSSLAEYQEHKLNVPGVG